MFKNVTEIPALPFDMIVDENERFEFTFEMDRLMSAGLSVNEALDVVDIQASSTWN